MVRLTSRLLVLLAVSHFAASAVLAGTHRSGDVAIESAVFAVEGRSIAESPKEDQRNQPVRIQSRGCPDLIITFSGITHGKDDPSIALGMPTAFTFGELKVGFQENPDWPDKVCEYEFTIGYTYVVKLLYYVDDTDHPIMGTSAPIRGSISGRVIRTTTGALNISLFNKQVIRENDRANRIQFREPDRQKINGDIVIAPLSSFGQSPETNSFQFAANEGRGRFVALISAR